MKLLETRPRLKGFLFGIPTVFLAWEAYGVMLGIILFAIKSDWTNHTLLNLLMALFWAALWLVLSYFSLKGFPLATGFLLATPIALLLYIVNGLLKIYLVAHSVRCP